MFKRSNPTQWYVTMRERDKEADSKLLYMVDGITVLSNKLGLYISRAINYFILTNEIKVINTALDKDRMIIIAMYGYTI